MVRELDELTLDDLRERYDALMTALRSLLVTLDDHFTDAANQVAKSDVSKDVKYYAGVRDESIDILGMVESLVVRFE